MSSFESGVRMESAIRHDTLLKAARGAALQDAIAHPSTGPISFRSVSSSAFFGLFRGEWVGVGLEWAFGSMPSVEFLS